MSRPGMDKFVSMNPSIGKNTAELERPGFAYLKASFSF